MAGKEWRVSTFKNDKNVVWGFASVVLLDIMSIAGVRTMPVVAVVGIILFTGILGIGGYAFMKSRRTFAHISDKGVGIHSEVGMVQLGWVDVYKVGIQVLIFKRAGAWEAHPHLALFVTDESKQRLASIQTKKSGILYRNQSDVQGFLGETRADFYINLFQMVDNEGDIIELLKQQKGFTNPIKPLVDTQSQEEYDRLFKENFNYA